MMGMDPVIISDALDLPLGTVKSLAAVRMQRTRTLMPADEAVAEKMRHLFDVAYTEGLWTLQFGAPAERSSLIRAILGRATSLIGAADTTRFDEMRAEFDGMMGDIRTSDDYLDTIPTDENDAELDALTGDSHDSN